INSSDRFVLAQCWAGAALSINLAFGLAPGPTLPLLWLLYLSLLTAGRIFLAYQWDILLLETGFLAVFLCPFDFIPSLAPRPAPSGDLVIRVVAVPPLLCLRIRQTAEWRQELAKPERALLPL